jgi:hypothetical protein
MDLRIFPYSTGYSLGIQCNYVIFTFDNDTDQDTVYQELSVETGSQHGRPR